MFEMLVAEIVENSLLFGLKKNIIYNITKRRKLLYAKMQDKSIVGGAIRRILDKNTH